MDDRLSIGVFLPLFEDQDGGVPRWPEIRALAREAEAIGVDTLWVPDHLLFRRDMSSWEGWGILAALAATTERAALGTLVSCTTFRNPTLLAKMADTVDEISGGRLVLGLGAGLPDRDESFPAFGFPRDVPVGRFAEALAIIASLLRDGRVDFDGRYHQARDCTIRPRGPRPGGPPIWIGGRGPRMMRLAARWADAFNIQAALREPAEIAAPLATMRAACSALGRDPATLGCTGYATLSFAPAGADPGGYRAHALRGTPRELAARLHALHRAGVQQIALKLDDGRHQRLTTSYPRLTGRALEYLADVLQHLRHQEADSRGSDERSAVPA